ncbi:hypothetical protein RHMOL_Rhmol01G0344100 [Rhododendron molle]|uniref:Uncharacterized protein n=1 Tax=Rhododendron molle TaxID=49168 RepID=A0ACC0QA58_RHOML|nr:hypothetical protein RHMOL_Rhmol01G0344100 [Rhododendron molle]
MDRYQKVEKPRPEVPINENEIRITASGLVRNYLTYATTLLQERRGREIVLKAMGNAISKTVAIAEIIKRRIPQLHQDTAISSVKITDVYEPIEEGLSTVEQTRQIRMVEGEAVVEGEDGVGTGVDMETTKVEITKKMAVIQTGAEVVVVDMATITQVKITKKMANIQTLAEVVGVAEVGATVVLGMTQVGVEVGMTQVEAVAGEVVMTQVEAAVGEVGMTQAEAGEVGMTQVEAGAGEVGMTQVETAAGEVGTTQAEMGEVGTTQAEAEAGEVGMTQVEAGAGEAAEVMAVAVDGWAAARGVVETKHNGELVFPPRGVGIPPPLSPPPFPSFFASAHLSLLRLALWILDLLPSLLRCCWCSDGAPADVAPASSGARGVLLSLATSARVMMVLVATESSGFRSDGNKRGSMGAFGGRIRLGVEFSVCLVLDAEVVFDSGVDGGGVADVLVTSDLAQDNPLSALAIPQSSRVYKSVPFAAGVYLWSSPVRAVACGGRWWFAKQVLSGYLLCQITFLSLSGYIAPQGVVLLYLE